MKTIRFTESALSDFSITLRSRVNAYFKQTQKSRYGNLEMILKTLFMLSLYFVPVLLVTVGVVGQTWQLFLCFILSGLGMAGIGMGVMHDAIHGTYSKNKHINKLLGYTLNLVGANATLWKIQHNVLHHSFTNIHEGDDDINMPFFLRFSPNAKKNVIHSYQHLYTWFFYGLSTLSWVTTKDFVRLNRYYKMGLLRGKNIYRNTVLKIIAWKVLYYTFILVLPILFSPFSIGQVFLAFIALHFVTGLSISLVFQTAHIMPDVTFPTVDSEGKVEGERMIHQLLTTCNYSEKNRVFSWLIGGLNYQIEHHLFPDICHVHYRKLAPIVRKTAAEYELPYYSKVTFFQALKSHFKMLHWLGNTKVAS
ncbi:acyl-CoA desaturase [Echinicola strongylocentroti]|uniref:Acyl-CoA desaturase n=1 Tax=Echinicola strongylocentroti TaxID=1795355 RepID=A0A2Z4IHV6_9BACT|nr:acyl-CoA desaturase [Echinicola strongylocentroti]